jgi:hypothetical protein
MFTKAAIQGLHARWKLHLVNRNDLACQPFCGFVRHLSRGFIHLGWQPKKQEFGTK